MLIQPEQKISCKYRRKETRDEFIARHNSSYESIKYINTHTPENATIRLIFLAGRGYYLERTYSEGSVYGIGDMQSLVQAQDKRTFRNVLQSLDCTHLLIRTDLLEKYLKDNYAADIRQTFFRRLDEAMEVLYQKQLYGFANHPGNMKNPLIEPERILSRWSSILIYKVVSNQKLKINWISIRSFLKPLTRRREPKRMNTAPKISIKNENTSDGLPPYIGMLRLELERSYLISNVSSTFNISHCCLAIIPVALILLFAEGMNQ